MLLPGTASKSTINLPFILQVWPNMGLHQACIAKLASLLEHDCTALQAVQAAVDILQYTHPDSNILQQQLRLRHDLLYVKFSAAKVAMA